MNDIIIIPLGSVSPYCKNENNCPGFLVKYEEYNILLDCGNGITRLLSFPNILNNLYIIITHLHKDHYGDLGCIEYASYVYHNLNQIDDRIQIYLPELLERDYNYSDYHLINNDMTIYLSDLKITFHDNKSHGIKSYMIKLETKNKKVVYTSDIGNTNLDDVINYCKNADLLICECSLLNDDNCKLTTHLHTSDVSMIAREANVKKLLLTHFYPEIDKQRYLDEVIKSFSNTEVAIENKQIILRGNICRQ